MRSLAAAATVGARHVPDSTAGKKENAALLKLLARLRNIYCEVHGESARKVTTDPDTGRHSGPFYEFTRDAFQALGVPKRYWHQRDSTALGQNILKVIRLRDAANRREGKLKIE